MPPPFKLVTLDNIILAYLEKHPYPAHWENICNVVKFDHKFMKWQTYGRLKYLTKQGKVQRFQRGWYCHKDYENVSIEHSLSS